MWNECGGPQFKKFVDLVLQKLSIGKDKFHEFETSTRCEG